MTDKIHPDPDLIKTRRISFAGLTADDICIVVDILSELEHVEALPGEDGCSMVVTYSIVEHKLDELEGVLSAQGYRLDINLLERIRLSLIHFTEEIQQDNLHTPLHSLTRDDRLHAIYANAHERHLDESASLSPEDLRNEGQLGDTP
ncbi:MAG: hypothetical protein KKH74_12515 [Gammaproteobacteria bacterium]|nr:hypothetical protein [Gammaproteobacteria bacterium]MBU1731817.1 hypothetical protein [Gammaproteobacteria bacterium]MBU1892428.1 hypothetical protein [Gammaproteobacteria bacterium]